MKFYKTPQGDPIQNYENRELNRQLDGHLKRSDSILEALNALTLSPCDHIKALPGETQASILIYRARIKVLVRLMAECRKISAFTDCVVEMGASVETMGVLCDKAMCYLNPTPQHDNCPLLYCLFPDKS